MFRALGNFVARRWPWLLAGWFALLIGVPSAAPPWPAVVRDGESSFLDATAPSRRGADLYERAFARDLQGSSVVVVARRVNEPLGPSDWIYVERVLGPWLEVIAYRANQDPADPPPEPIRVRTFDTGPIGELLESDDGRATLVIVQLPGELTDSAGRRMVGRIEEKIAELRRTDNRRQRIPAGLHVSLTGTATAARDMHRAAEASARAIERWCVGLLAVLLLAFFRAPLLAIIPLATAVAARQVALGGLALLARAGAVHLFAGIEIYVTVMLYGASVGYCLFLMARYREELDDGATLQDGMARAIEKTGTALAAGAATTIIGVGMLGTAEFGKFRALGVAIPLAVACGWAAALTCAPALLLACRQWAFWPHVRRERIAEAAGWFSPTRPTAGWLGPGWGRWAWHRTGRLLTARPALLGLAAVALLVPPAAVGVAWHDRLSYGLLSELPPNAPSRLGTAALQEHFAAGEAGPVTMLIHTPGFDYRTSAGIDAVGTFTRRLAERRDALGIADIRSLSHPLGLRQPSVFEQRIFLIPWWKERAFENYVSDRGARAGDVTRVDVVFQGDPFAHDSIRRFEQLERTAAAVLPAELGAVVQAVSPQGGRQSRLALVGPTAEIRDQMTVTRRDQARLIPLVLLSVFLVLAVMLRRPATAACVVAALSLAAGAALGTTFLVVWLLDPAAAAVLDSELPLLLAAILIAAGADYTIYLLTRVAEEQSRAGGVRGVTAALAKTGGAVSRCGLATAAALAALTAGSLVGLQQLGFALAVGMLLATFVVRPVLVPAYLILLHAGRFGTLGRWLGAQNERPVTPVVSRPLSVARQTDYEATDN